MIAFFANLFGYLLNFLYNLIQNNSKNSIIANINKSTKNNEENS